MFNFFIPKFDNFHFVDNWPLWCLLQLLLNISVFVLFSADSGNLELGGTFFYVFKGKEGCLMPKSESVTWSQIIITYLSKSVPFKFTGIEVRLLVLPRKVRHCFLSIRKGRKGLWIFSVVYCQVITTILASKRNITQNIFSSWSAKNRFLSLWKGRKSPCMTYHQVITTILAP